MLNFVWLSAQRYAMLMSSNKDKTAVHGCHYPGDVAVHMRKVLAIPRSCVV